MMTQLPRAVPPRTPGPMVPRQPPPLEPASVASTVWSSIGLVLPPCSIVGIVMGVVGLRRLRAAETVKRGHGLAVCGIVLGAIGLLGALVYLLLIGATFWAGNQTAEMIRAQSVQAIHQGMRDFERRTGRRATHVAELIISDRGPVHPGVFGPEPLSGADPPRGSVVLGGYDFADYEATEEAIEAVRAAIAAVDPIEPYYRFGGWTYVRVGRTTLDPDIVFAWRIDDGKRAVVLTDNGEPRLVLRDRWSDLWSRDAEERARRKLPPLQEPPFE